MLCERCETKTIVIDSRLNEKRDSVRRRRECPECNTRFTTFEIKAEEIEAIYSKMKWLVFDDIDRAMMDLEERIINSTFGDK